MSKSEKGQGIAIIGVGLRFPNSDTLDEFWDHLMSGESLITEIPAERWDKNEFYGDPQKGTNKTNSMWGGFIDQANCFDASFFNISPREAKYMDPQQRITLELAWKAIEDAGYRAGALKSTKTGVFMGVSNTDYTELMEKHLRDFDAYVPTGASNAIISNRISYWFDFKGPSITIDTACASSLVAIHQAVRSLEDKDCEYALAGGVNLCWSPRRFIALSKSGMLSKSGKCRAFDENADGYVRGEGAAVLLLKPLDKAIEDRDTIYAVIKGVGTNHGGRTNSLTITNPKAQAELITEVYEKAGISPDSVGYIEAHGPGTPLGDPIEIHGLKNAFRHLYQKQGKPIQQGTCGLGSVKTNIGHLEAAAGIAGVIKVLAAMKHRTLPASINFQQQNPMINFEDSPFYIVNKTTPWDIPDNAPFPRRAGVSSFGFGGSNAHILLEEYVPQEQAELSVAECEAGNGFMLIPLSAENSARLHEYVAVLLKFLQRYPGLILRNLAYTFQVGREAMQERVVFLPRSIADLISQCEAFLQKSGDRSHCWFEGQVKEEKNLSRLPAEESFSPESKDQWYAKCPIEKIAELWAGGYIIEWELLPSKNSAKRINLPTYQFARNPYWIPTDDDGNHDKASVAQNVALTIHNSREYSRNTAAAVTKDLTAYLCPDVQSDEITLTSLSSFQIPSDYAEPENEPCIILTALDASLKPSELKQVPLPEAVPTAPTTSINVLMNELTISLAEALDMKPDEIDNEAKFVDLGLDSIIGVEWIRKLNEHYGTLAAVTKVYDYPTIGEFTEFMSGEIKKQSDGKLPGYKEPVGDLHQEYQANGISRNGNVELQPLEAAFYDESGAAATAEEFRDELKASLAEALDMKPDEIDNDAKFVDLGLDSIIGVEWIRKLNEQYGTSVAVTKVYDYPTLSEFTEFMAGKIKKQSAGEFSGHEEPVGDLHQEYQANGISRNENIELQPVEAASYDESGAAATAEEFRNELKASLAEALDMKPDEIDNDAKFVDLGLDSIIGVEWIRKLNEQYGISVAVTKVYDYPTLSEFTEFIKKESGITKKHGDVDKLTLTEVTHEAKIHSVAVSKSNAYKPDSKRNITVQTNRSDKPVTADQAVVDLQDVGSGIVQITMRDKMNKNKFSEELVRALIQTIETIQRDPKYKIIILTGYDTYFAAGGTQENLLNIYQGKSKYTDTNLYRVALDCKLPIIAAMQGHGIGAGWCFGMSCDFVVMSQESYYAANFMKFGFTPGFGSTLIFPEKFGSGLAEEILFTGKRYRGSELKARGIHFPVLPRAEVLPYAVQLAKELAESPRESLIILKNHMAESLREKISGTIAKEIHMHDQTFVNQSGVRERIESLFGQFSAGVQSNKPDSNVFGTVNTSKQPESKAAIAPVVSAKYATHSPEQTMQDAVAIIGMSGQFPKSKNLSEFWDNLANGRDCVSEVPDTRWSMDKYYDPDRKAEGKSHCKWMGVLEDADLFDPLFFNIAPAEAELMDPQQRLFLQQCWSCIEDAGLNPSSLSGSRCGVFVGCATNDYGKPIDVRKLNAQCLMGGNSSILSARIAYFLNLKGPCLAIDTACSSSLVAISEACDSLMLQTSNLALAGGVCVLPGPAVHIMTSKAGMLSKDGRCFTFDNRANGFVPSEGVGVVLLKRLADAVRDQDHIYGVIRGWGINQDGRTNGITAPSVNSQIFLEKEVYQRFGINPESISMVEAHGTGTKLGDPIEVEALTESFRSYTKMKSFCALGSVKSNIGHPLAAAGIAGVIKVLLSLQHRMLPPTIHYKNLNEHIALDNSPFYINSKMQEWKSAQAIPRRACVSSFGFSGTNSHLVIEEYSPAQTKRTGAEIHPGNPALFVLSAKGEAQLKVYAGLMKDFLECNPDLDLANMAYTLQVGRDAMDYRLAFIADSREAVLKALAEFRSNPFTPGIFTGHVQKGKDDVRVFEADSDAEFLTQTWIRKKKFAQIADLWIKGMNPDWSRLYGSNLPCRISLPTYPFSRESFWVGVNPVQICGDTVGARAPLHPLLHQNTSDLWEQRFSSTFTGREPFLADYKINGTRIFPWALYLEMARAAVVKASGAEADKWGTLQFRNITWLQPVVLGEPAVDLHIGITPASGGELDFEIYANSDDDDGVPEVFCRGSIVPSSASKTRNLDLAVIQARCTVGRFESGECYEALRSAGMDYGSGYRGIESIQAGKGQVLARLALPDQIGDAFVLRPGIVEGALQATVGLVLGHSSVRAFRPATLQGMEIINPCVSAMWAYLKTVDGNPSTPETKFDIYFCDDTGKICLTMKELVLTGNSDTVPQAAIPARTGGLADPELSSQAHTEPYEIMTFEEVWQKKELEAGSSVGAKTLVCFLSQPQNQKAFAEELAACNQEANVIFVARGTAYEKRSPNEYMISAMDPASYHQALRSIQEHDGGIDAVLYLWALEEQDCVKDPLAIVYILRAIAGLNRKPGRLLLAAQIRNALDRCYLESWIGFERSLGLVLPQTQVAAIYHEADAAKREFTMNDWARTLWTELGAVKAQSGFYKAGERYVYQIKPAAVAVGNPPFRQGGTYLITGGCGGLGFLFAEHLAKAQPVNLILTGRSALDSVRQSKISRLEAMGSRVFYLQADVTDSEAMAKGLRKAKESFGEIHGVIHAAGVVAHKNIFEKGIESFQAVLNPKIKGTLVMDDLLNNDPLDFICYFSSAAAILGDFGACDYSVANRFQMAYTSCRNQMRRRGDRRGKAIVINWPLWRDGGMGFEDEQSKMYLKSSGQRYLEAQEGMAVFDRIVAQDREQLLVLAGQPSRVLRFLGLPSEATSPLSEITARPDVKKRPAALKGLSLAQCLEWDLKERISDLLKISREKINREDNLADFGFDSIYLAQFAEKLSDYFGFEISPAVFFGHANLEKLVQYFLGEHAQAIREFYPEEVTEQIPAPPVSTAQAASGIQKTKKFRLARAASSIDPAEPIAIIGMSGRFPDAYNIEKMWTLLAEGRDTIKEIPKDRFDWRLYYSDSSPEPGKTNCKWCACIPGAAEFDPLFFEISPREAELMDPRQRLLMQESWKALEDAGYGPVRIRAGKIGMFVGAEDGDYKKLVKDRGSITSNHTAILAARLAYFLNLTGPVMAINTACSSGLVAAHEACLSLRAGECDTAIAAGVNLMLTPEPLIHMSQAGMMSGSGTCYAFDKRADGLVPGEAVAAVVFKPLSKAQADGDPIYAVVRGSGINYDGKTNGITAPNGVSQTNLLKSVYDQYQVNPEEIQFIITHGTGTRLGDPIEINALNDAFKEYTHKQGYCAVTSTKTNFGHTFAASGLVSLISMVEALQHETIPASLHCEQENDFINWHESPFYVNKVNHAWPALPGRERLGAVSALGMSGTNAHLVVQSYSAGKSLSGCRDDAAAPYTLLALSARTPEALQERIAQLIAVLRDKNRGAVRHLSAMSYTLLEGRQHFEYRCAVVIQDLDDAVYVLGQAAGKEKLPNLFRGRVPRDFTGQKAICEYARDLLARMGNFVNDRDKYQELLYVLADLYCQGYDLPWNLLFGERRPQMLHLPTYPFSRENYWVARSQPSGDMVTAAATTVFIHPLLQRNTSDFNEQRYSSVFSGREFFLADHRVKGHRIIPGVAYLEMARAAVAQAAGISDKTWIRLKNIVWTRPIPVDDEPVKVHIGLFPEDNGEIAFEIYTETGGSEPTSIIHSQGTAWLTSAAEIIATDLQALRTADYQHTYSGAQCYEKFRSMQLEYGPEFKGIKNIFVAKDRILAELSLPSVLTEQGRQFVMHPGMVDSALQSSIGWMMGSLENSGQNPSIPFALDELEIFGGCTETMWAFVHSHNVDSAGAHGREPGGMRKLDLELYDEAGTLCVRMKGCASRVLEGEPGAIDAGTAPDTLLAEPCWREAPSTGEAANLEYGRNLVIFCDLNQIDPQTIERNLQHTRCMEIKAVAPFDHIAARFETYAIRIFEEIQKHIKTTDSGNMLLQIVIPSQGSPILYRGFSGLLRTAKMENPRLSGQIIEVEFNENTDTLCEKLHENRNRPMDMEIRYREGKRYVLGWNELQIQPEARRIPWKDGGVYLITGGAGGLGLIFAREILRQTRHVTLILTGRSTPDGEKLTQFKRLEQPGACIEYQTVDVSKKEAVNSLIENIRKKYGGLNGIIHSAGVVRDNYILKKDPEELREVLAPKVAGAVNLDEASREIALDFMILFSSSTGTLGNPGQADYAMANTFMDAYAGYRNLLAAAKQRHGKTLSINWPLWKEGGMRVNSETEKFIRENTGIVPMRTETGIQALYDALVFGHDQVMVLQGERPRLKQKILAPNRNLADSKAASLTVEPVDGGLHEKVQVTLTQILAQLFKVTTADIDTDVELSEYGLNMALLAELVNRLNRIYQLDLSVGLFIEQFTLDSLADYLIRNYEVQLCRKYGICAAKFPKTREESKTMDPEARNLLAEKALNYFKKLIATFIKLPLSQIETDAHMEKYGLDSVLVMQLTNHLEKTFGSLSKTLFFEYQNIQQLTDYFLDNYRDRLVELLGTGEKAAVTGKEITTANTPNLPAAFAPLTRRRSRFAGIVEYREEKASGRALDIAIIGVSGRYPGAKNLQEFWRNLKNGKDCITEIPKDRWDYRRYFNEDKNVPGKTYSKWGGFIDGVAEFDPLFFNISPREAEMMDPQERLFLECVYSTLEDAGYTRQALGANQGNGMPGNVGVFAGVMYEEYQLYAAQAQILGTPLVLSGNPASIANRVSFFFNFHGPSMAVDTMCSSSLATIHLACHSLQRGECEAAIAGGVNVSIHPNKYLVLGKGHFVSSKGRCESFGQGGDGYVPGEGVGAVLLKPLSKAVADGDHIYGVIKGTAVNHGGKTNGYTVPNPNAQAEVIKQAIIESGVHPRTVSYIEAHGTGTSLGDPIEVAGLNKVFREYTHDKHFCAIGSVKSNIGHCESAAGIAAVTKVLLQLKYRQLVPSLHSEVLNPNIDLSDTPFVVQQELAELKRPVVTINGETREYPIITGVSSFGAGGSNAHVIISEYVPEDMGQSTVVSQKSADTGRVVIVLSAKNEDRLKDRVRQLLIAIREGQIPEESLVDLSYTLQTGREAMEERLAMVVFTMRELAEKLEGFLAGKEGIEDLYMGQVKRGTDALKVFTVDEDLQKAIGAWIAKGKYSKLLDLWVKGLAFDWHKLYGNQKPKRISLPTYPFAREQYWIPEIESVSADTAQAASASGKERGIRRIGGILKKQWEPCKTVRSGQAEKTVLILASGQNRPLATLIAKHFPNHRIVDREELEAQLKLPESQWKNYGGWIDLIGGEADSGESGDWIVCLQQLIEYGPREGVKILGVTCGLEAFRNSTVHLSGAERAGLYRMLQNEYSYLHSRHLDTDPRISDLERAEQIVMEFLADSQDPEVCYRNGERYRAYLDEIPEPQASSTFVFPEDHVLWITGGTRGLGFLCAKHFVTRFGVKRLVLTGREALPPRNEWDRFAQEHTQIAKKIKAIRDLEAAGANVAVSTVPLTDQEGLESYLLEIHKTMGPVGGVIHCAGIGDAENPALIRKSVDGIRSILEPKVRGLETVYQALKNEPLKFFILFSSVSSIIPALAVGQSDYTMANAYMDYFAEAHSKDSPLVSIQWPSWKETGMGEIKSKVYKETGLLSITNAEGLQLLDHILSTDVGPVVLPAVVDPGLWRPKLLMRGLPRERIAASGVPAVTQTKSVGGETGNTVETAVYHRLKEVFAKELKLDSERLELDTEFQEYGMDSILLAQVIQKIDQQLQGVSLEPSVLIEYPTIRSLTHYLMKTYPEALAAMRSDTDHVGSQGPRRSPESVAEPAAPPPMNTPVFLRVPDRKMLDRIAVVGMACHFPDAEDIGQYWQNLRAGRDSIREVPKSRWDWREYYDPRGFKEGKSISKWGAFLADIESFDPQYFKIAEAVAPQIDPLQRQWLEVSAEALADAGFTKNDLWGKMVGVFAGSRAGKFSDKLRKTDKNRIIGTGQNFIAAHLAHIYNFKGPNMVIDTACSSSLTAIHSAIRSIQCGESELALAGGVDILLDEAVYLTLSSAKVLSPDGRCKTFDADANGIGIGEGCGVLVLKPLSKAIEDGNKIYGVIDGSAINSDGNTMGVTTPNPEAQRELIEKTIADANIDPQTISYVETHGTGTLIGDPIELRALTRIFTKYSPQKQFCGVGSVKSNIGHLLSASGAASIIKVLLAMIHRELPPTLHCDKPNPRFNFEDSPFYIVQKVKPWQTQSEILRAGISSFGLGGNNAHMIISNEGIPDNLKASVVPRGEKIVYNRKRYWPEGNPGSEGNGNNTSGKDEEAEFIEFFKFGQE